MKGQVTNNIMEYMNSMSKKKFTYVMVSSIATSIKDEYHDRKEKRIKINGKTQSGRLKINERVAEIVNQKLGIDGITPNDVKLYKKCFAEEYTNRTGKCAWGFKDLRKRLGYDPNTAKEIVTY